MQINKEIESQYPWKVKWDKRAKEMAKYIGAKCSVLDIGGGLGNLHQYLMNPEKYVSIDNRPWTDCTVVADLNTKFPKLGKFDIVVCQGIIEYIDKLKGFLTKLHKYSDEVVVSYRLNKDTRKVMERNDYTFEQIEMYFEANGWEILKMENLSDKENIYLLKNATKKRV